VVIRKKVERFVLKVEEIELVGTGLGYSDRDDNVAAEVDCWGLNKDSAKVVVADLGVFNGPSSWVSSVRAAIQTVRN